MRLPNAAQLFIRAGCFRNYRARRLLADRCVGQRNGGQTEINPKSSQIGAVFEASHRADSLRRSLGIDGSVGEGGSS